MSTDPENARSGFGLDKDARLAGKRAKEAEENRPKPLDPPFPYRVIAFDPIFARRRGL